MIGFARILAAMALLIALPPASASAQFGLKGLSVSMTAVDGSPQTQAGSHPFDMSTSFGLNTREEEGGKVFPDGAVRNLEVELPKGFAGNPTAVPHCSSLDFLKGLAGCPDSSAVGLVRVAIGAAGQEPQPFGPFPVYNLEPPPGVAAKLGFYASKTVPQMIELGVNPNPPYNVIATLRNTPQILEVFGSQFTIWGNPADEAHDPFRGACLRALTDFEKQPPSLIQKDLLEAQGAISKGNCPANIPVKPFITLPRSCEGPLATLFYAEGWWEGDPLNPSPAIPFEGTATSASMTGCSKLGLSPTITSRPSSERAESGAGLSFTLDLEDEGLQNPDGIAKSDIKKAVVTLPEGVTINPSVGEGLAVCTPDQLDRETAFSAPGEGCPNASKLGTLHVETPLIEQAIDGSIFLAQQDDPKTSKPGAENPFDTLIALYFVLQNRELGISVKEPVKVEPDPQTGQLLVTLDDNVQLPFSRFEAHLRTGARAALVTPNACGTYTTEAEFYPWANPAKAVPASASFQINAGVKGGPCPQGGVPPFGPGFEAGALNNAAGAHSPFSMRLTRKDGEQDMTKFSAILPPGQVGSLVGVQKCSDNAVAVAESKTGREELANPSCPAGSEIGDTLAGAGVGEALTYVGGKIYLAGSYKGRPLSVIAITPAVAGPFDAGTVAIRLALTLNPKTAEVEVDGAASDPIPHILQGIVLKVRDIGVDVNRPNFLVNPTSCAEESTRATLFGSFLNVFDPNDDVPVGLRSRYQAADCASLPFKPRLNLRLSGGTKRGGHPGLKATYRPRKGDANVEGLITRLPRSAFLDQAHIRTICTRVQFAADACPKAAQYGYIKAWTPLLEEPLEGPVWLRSSTHKLPDLVFDLHGLVDVEVATRIDSARGGIRATVEDAPDAALTKVVLRMQGAKKGLIINSRNLCGAISRANVQFDGHNGKRATSNPVMRADCGGKRKRSR